MPYDATDYITASLNGEDLKSQYSPLSPHEKALQGGFEFKTRVGQTSGQTLHYGYHAETNHTTCGYADINNAILRACKYLESPLYRSKMNRSQQ
jgi:hypothetical protein